MVARSAPQVRAGLAGLVETGGDAATTFPPSAEAKCAQQLGDAAPSLPLRPGGASVEEVEALWDAIWKCDQLQGATESDKPACRANWEAALRWAGAPNPSGGAITAASGAADPGRADGGFYYRPCAARIPSRRLKRDVKKR